MVRRWTLCWAWFAVLCAAGPRVRAGNIDPNNDGSRYAYAQNAGWLNWQPRFGPGATVVDANVNGYVWAQNIGWVNLAPAFGGVYNDGTGRLCGFAWGQNVGWVNFRPHYGGVLVDSQGRFDGWAWGQNIGWVHFRSERPPQYVVTTAWRTDCRVTAADLDALAAQWLWQRRSGLAGHWDFETGYGDVAADGGSGGNTLSLMGDTRWCGGACGDFAADFDGTGDYLRSATVIRGLDFAPGSFTASAWIRPRIVSDGWRTILEYDRAGTNWFGLWVSGEARFHFRVGGDRRDSIAVLTPDQWCHVAGRYDASTKQLRLYVNGRFDSSTVYSTIRYDSPRAAKLTIGVRGTEDSEYFDGMIDDVRIYARALDERYIPGLAWGSGADMDLDGDVDFVDYTELACYWLSVCPPGWPLP